MKKIIILFIMILTILFIPNVYAENVSIESITLDSKSDSAEELNEAKYSNLKINFDIKFAHKDDYIKYKILINNPTDEYYEILDNNNNISEYITYEYSFDDNNRIIESNKKSILYITIKYNKEVPEDQLIQNRGYIENNSINLSLSGEINPETGRIVIKSLIFIILVLGISLTIYCNRRNKKIYIILLGILLIPITVYAIKKLDVSIESKISIEQPTVFYINDIMYRFDPGMTWDEWIDSNNNTINAYKLNYYEKTILNENETYYYFDNDEEGIIIGESASKCTYNHYVYNYIYIINNNKNVTPNDLIENNNHYTISIGTIC